jgi:hypothetical protein
LLFVFHHACFLFPCLCAPEVPGYLFFPPSGDIDSPLSGTFDANYYLVLRRIYKLEEWDCVWVPPETAADELAARRLADGAGPPSPVLALFTGALAGWLSE